MAKAQQKVEVFGWDKDPEICAIRLGEKRKKDILHFWADTEGRIWVAGMGTMYARQGFPIECSLDILVAKGLTPCFLNAVLELCKNGMVKETAIRTVRSAIKDFIGEETEHFKFAKKLFYDQFGED